MDLIPGAVRDRVLVTQAVAELRTRTREKEVKELELKRLERLLQSYPSAQGREIEIQLDVVEDALSWTITSVMYGTEEESVSVPFSWLPVLITAFRGNGVLEDAYRIYQSRMLRNMAEMRRELLAEPLDVGPLVEAYIAAIDGAGGAAGDGDAKAVP